AAECDGQAPAEQPGGPDWDLLHGRLVRLAGELREAYSTAGFDPRRAVALLDELVDCAADFGFVQEHGERPQARRAALAAQLAAPSALAAWAAPVLRAGAERLAALIGAAPGGPVDASALTPPAAGTKVAEPAGPVFGARPE